MRFLALSLAQFNSTYSISMKNCHLCYQSSHFGAQNISSWRYANTHIQKIRYIQTQHVQPHCVSLSLSLALYKSKSMIFSSLYLFFFFLPNSLLLVSLSFSPSRYKWNPTVYMSVWLFVHFCLSAFLSLYLITPWCPPSHLYVPLSFCLATCIIHWLIVVCSVFHGVNE